ncbi:MAG TPA: YebC/PmpR family DNA-binding transcriptional regulator [candidate division WWE3 bacterium]|uniref:Probable transcriptional regulatory protein ENN92_00020 n=1 Tax=candidate division WWE3 bacterium TaxID=2053526 RepID=A0A7C1DNY2_UNCKA|nr:YebC/PmpR family DNA-binding transcriptional regulator [candidate division WWE3 bacterium]
MSGHNKWSKIKHQKGVTDARKSTSFSKISRRITISARTGGGDPSMNPTLALMVEKAKEVNMPKDTIERAIKKGTGELGDGADIDEIVYEGYGPFGVAIVIKTLTDNRNRTVAEIRNILERFGGSLGTLGSASYIFDKQNIPSFTVPLDETQYNKVADLLDALDAQDDVVDIYANHSKS